MDNNSPQDQNTDYSSSNSVTIPSDPQANIPTSVPVTSGPTSTPETFRKKKPTVVYAGY